MKEKTANNVHVAFVAEAKAYQRLLAFAEKAQKEELPQIAKLFRAVAFAESVHARRHFLLLEAVKDTQSNLEYAFQQENAANGIYYPKMIQDATEEEEKAATVIFSQARDAEAAHAKLYKNALEHLMAERETEYHVCSVCGYVSEKEAPDNCPVCNAPKSKFVKVE